MSNYKSLNFQKKQYNNNDMSSNQENTELLNEVEMKQVFDSNKGQSKKNYKVNNWVIYCKRRGKKSMQLEYSKDLQQVGSFNTLKDFFNFHASIKQPSCLQIDTKIIYFLKGCKPFWQEWLHSGCLLITIKFKDEEKDKTGQRVLDSTWQFVLFGLVGNTLPKPRLSTDYIVERVGYENIIGVILSRRDKISLIQIWFRNEIHAAQLSRLIQQDIMKHLKLKVQQKTYLNIKYKRHRDSIQSNSTIKGAYNIKATSNKSF